MVSHRGERARDMGGERLTVLDGNREADGAPVSMMTFVLRPGDGMRRISFWWESLEGCQVSSLRPSVQARRV